MRNAIRFARWAVFPAIALLLAPALTLAQGMPSGGIGGGAGGIGGGAGGFGGSPSSSGFGGGMSGASGSNSSFFGGNTGNTGSTGFTGTNTSSPTGGGARGSSASSPVNQSNVFSSYFANGFSTSFNSTSLTRTMGNFGQPLYKISTPTASATAASLGSASVGGRGSSSAASSTNLSNANYGAVMSETTRRPAVAAMLDDTFPVNVPAGGRLAADLHEILDRSTFLTSKDNISILVDGRVVTLRGVVPNDNERRLAESMLRLTPGVGMIKNELTVPNKSETTARAP